MVQINVLPISDVGVLDYLMFPDQHPSNLDYFRNQVESISATLNDYGRRFMETSRDLYNTVHDSRLVNAAKAAMRYISGAHHPNEIVYFNTLDDLRTAQPIMQRYVMADPVIRQAYFDYRIDGYSDTYVDMQPGKIGVEHYDYRRMMNGIVQDGTDEHGNYEWCAHIFTDELYEGDRELTLVEKVMAMRAGDLARMFLEAGKKDPTDVYGGDIK